MILLMIIINKKKELDKVKNSSPSNKLQDDYNNLYDKYNKLTYENKELKNQIDQHIRCKYSIYFPGKAVL